MPRSKEFQNDLSEGWKQLYLLWKLPLEDKIEYSNKILQNIFSNHDNIAVYWSGGKDSTVILHQALQFNKKIPVIFNDSLVEFPETYEFINRLEKEWDLNLYRTTPNTTLWEIGEIYGWPILGKNIASNVERAKRTGNFRKQLTNLEINLAKQNLHISTKCAEILREKPAKILENELGIKLKLLGLRADESRARVRLWVDYGDCYFVKHYFKKNFGIWKASSISIWTEKDIWDYHAKYNIPHNALYDMGHPRTGCWPCAMAVRNGQLERLYKSHNHLYEKLLIDTNMGNELLRVQSFFKKEKIQDLYTLDEKKLKMNTLFSDIKSY